MPALPELKSAPLAKDVFDLFGDFGVERIERFAMDVGGPHQLLVARLLASWYCSLNPEEKNLALSDLAANPFGLSKVATSFDHLARVECLIDKFILHTPTGH